MPRQAVSRCTHIAAHARRRRRSGVVHQRELALCERGATCRSTITDPNLTLDSPPAAYEMNRTMRVIKMRGAAHATQPYQLQIGAGGLHIEKWSAQRHHASVEAQERWTGARS